MPHLDAAKNRCAKLLGHMGGLIGGARRAELLSAGRKSVIASKAACSRWGTPWTGFNRLREIEVRLAELSKIIEEAQEEYRTQAAEFDALSDLTEQQLEMPATTCAELIKAVQQ